MISRVDDRSELPSELPSELLGSGRMADVYAIDDERVVKLLKPGFEAGLVDVEAAKTSAAGRAGLPVPAVLGRMEIAGRPGLVLERVHGASTLDVAFGEPDNALVLAEMLADLHAAVLDTEAEGLPDVKEWLTGRIDLAELGRAHRVAAKNALDRLPDGSRTLHNDFHPANVLITDRGPCVIDWLGAVSGAAAADVCRTLVVMTPAAASEVTDVTSEIERYVIHFAAAYRRRCMQATGVTEAEVAAWRLPVVAARLAETIAGERQLLRAEIDRLTS